MQSIIFKDFTFESAHFLPNVPKGHKCGRLHGHSYKVRIFVSGEVDIKSGWVVDFSEIKKVWQPLHEILDHNFLNNIPGLENPTCEVLAKWIYDSMENEDFLIGSVQVMETCTCGAIYSGVK